MCYLKALVVVFLNDGIGDVNVRMEDNDGVECGADASLEELALFTEDAVRGSRQVLASRSDRTTPTK